MRGSTSRSHITSPLSASYRGAVIDAPQASARAAAAQAITFAVELAAALNGTHNKGLQEQSKHLLKAHEQLESSLALVHRA
mgnify:CR=1 FL=1